jgi:hypothetical protein
MNVEIGNVAAQFLFWEYFVQIFDIGSLYRCSLVVHPVWVFLLIKNTASSAAHHSPPVWRVLDKLEVVRNDYELLI